MKNETKANKARTCLLLKIESEVEHFKSIKTKINSISPYIYYNMYSNIEINIENPCEFFFNKRKSSIDFLMEKDNIFTHYHMISHFHMIMTRYILQIVSHIHIQI